SVATLELLMMIGALIVVGALVFSAPEAERVSATLSREAAFPVSVPSVLTLTEAAQYLRISEAEVIQLIDDGRIAAARIGGNYRIARVVLDELLQSREN
ncbi:MAG: helix-turn-helix domain-containing protein, partial [Anaerolineae bacterium]|nr:helix-turn-helix domain-containing protein [Anaerolineae bacterium]